MSIQRSEVSFNSAILACSRARQWQMTLELFDNLQLSLLEVDVMYLGKVINGQKMSYDVRCKEQKRVHRARTARIRCWLLVTLFFIINGTGMDCPQLALAYESTKTRSNKLTARWFFEDLQHLGRIDSLRLTNLLIWPRWSIHWLRLPFLLPTWKVNAFTCFAASSWGERIVEVDACCVQLVFGNHDFDYWYFYLRFCKIGIYLLCQYHGEFDRIGFYTLKFGDVVVLKWWGGLVARGSFFPF